MVEIAGGKEKLVKKAKALFDSYKERLWDLIANFVEEEAGRLGKWAANITHLRQKIRKAIVAFMLLFGGTVLILLGLADYLARILDMSSYAALIFVGFVAIIVGVIYYKA